MGREVEGLEGSRPGYERHSPKQQAMSSRPEDLVILRLKRPLEVT